MSTFPRPPVNSTSLNREWLNWYNRLTVFLADTTGLIPWLNINKAGSKLTDIQTRPHNDLQSIQGGTTDEYYHLTAAQLIDLTDGGDSAAHFHSADRARANHTGTQDHNSTLSGKQGGTTDEYYHLTSAEHSELQRGDNVASVAVDTVLDDTHRTVLVTASGKTITLPAASAARIGHDWTVILGVAGYTDIARAGSDTLNLPATESTVRLRTKGASVTLRCLTATSWGIA